jgi:transcriptional regulator with PAS, ATPase and Fis domain
MPENFVSDKAFANLQILEDLHGLIESLKSRLLTGPFETVESDLHQIKNLSDRFFSRMDLKPRIADSFVGGNEGRPGIQKLIGRSEAMRKVHELVLRAANTELPVLIQGESGTGKELIARAIHDLSVRVKSRFFTENCAAVPESLLESELFGYTRGSFTGANRDKAGILQLASGGTLFLDEIGDMSLGMQAKLLRTLQEGEIRRVGGEEIIKVDVRILSATNKVIEDRIRTGSFREDLYYRINVICIEVPPLRKRKEDIALLVNHFFGQIARRNQNQSLEITDGALELLQKYHWPGNIRELQNTIERAVVMCDGKSIDENTLLKATNQLGPSHASRLSGIATKTGEQLLVEEALLICSGDKTKAAHRIGWSRPKLYRKMRHYGIHRHFGKNLD